MLDDKQLRWRCRRGVRELDVLFTRFLDSEYADMSESEKSAFQRLLDVQDPVIMDWLFGKADAKDVELQAIIRRLQRSSGL